MKKKNFTLFLAIVASVATLMASMPTSISEYTQEGVTKGQAMSIPMTYLAFQVGCSSSSYIGVDMYAPSGKNYTIIGTSYTNWGPDSFQKYQYFNPVSWCYSITTVENGYAFFDLQSVESGVWTLRSIQKYAGEWYYIPAEEENNEEPIVLNATISQDCNLNGLNESHTTQNSLNGHSFVDLGLPSGLLWATCNVGASAPEQIGDYYAWGETQTKSNYSLSTYQYASNTISLSDISGTLYDAARVNWGGEWRMPSRNEVAELTSNCSQKDTTINGQSGLLLRGVNGNYIFIPCAGHWCNSEVMELTCKGFWTSTATGSRYAYRAWEWTYISFSEREQGFQIRPVISGGASLSTQTHTLTLYADGCENPNVYVFDEGQQVSISAIPQENNQFVQWSDGNTDNPRTITMTQNLTLTAVFTAVGGGSTGGIGLFSVSATQQVTFSPGNLQYQASTNTWRFAEHQWDIVGMGYGQTNTSSHCYIGGTVQNCDNRQIGSSYNGWIDLFGWGTSGWNSGANAYQPYLTSQTNSDYYPGGSYQNSLTGNYANADWGVYNQIGDDAPGSWRTLTRDEWVYLFNTRANASSKYGAAKVNGVTGVVVLPDNWVLPSGCGFTSGMTSASIWYDWSYVATTNIYTSAQWQLMESAGAVFLPAAGRRYGAAVSYAGSYGLYWSSTQVNTDYAYSLYFSSDDLDPQGNDRRYGGRSVRLVRVGQGEQEPVYSLIVSVEGEGTVTGAGEYKSGTTATLTATPASGYLFSQWSDGNTDNPRTITMTQDMNLSAVFAKNTFLVSFLNYDGTELQSSEVEAGTMPQYNGTDPTKPADAQYTYTFVGWDKEIVAVTTNATYTATYSRTVNQYTVTFMDGNTILGDPQTVEYGQSATAPDVEVPQCRSLAWDKDFSDVTADLTIQAVWTETLLASGTCGAQGDNLTWELSCDGVLTISGTGEMADFAKEAVPWNAQRNAISSVSVGDGVTSIGRYAFYECVNMASVAIPEGVTSIGDSAFYHCAALSELVLPNTLTTIGYRAFRDCFSLTSVTIPESVTSLGCGGTFQRCNALTTVNWNARNSEILPNADESYSPPFYSSEGGLPGITSFNFGENVERIPATLCYGMSGLTSITFPDGLKRIDNSAFSECAGLTSITIPANVEKTGNSVFNACTSLKEVTMLPETAPTFGSYIFSNISSNFSVIVPCGTMDAYKSALSYYASKIKYLPLEYSVSGLVNDAVAGSVTVPTNHCENTFTAVANEGYEFKQWSDGETANPRTVVLTQDTVLTAVFESTAFPQNDTTFIHNGENPDIEDIPGNDPNIVVEPGGELNVNWWDIRLGVITIVTTGGQSGQIHNADYLSNWRIFLEYKLNPLGSTASPNLWYAFAVPFEVDIENGITRAYGKKSHVPGVDFQILEYDGMLRAQTGKGWVKKNTGSLEPGTFYMIGIEGNCNRWLFEKKSGAAVQGDSHVNLNQYFAGNSDNGKHNGWNGKGNSRLEYSEMDLTGIANFLYLYNNEFGKFELTAAAGIELCVGQPFFIQASADASFDFVHNGGGLPMPALRAPQTAQPQMHFTLTSDQMHVGTDHMYITMHEDAATTYTIGRDVARMSMNCKTAAQLWCLSADGTELAAHDIALPETETVIPLGLFAPQNGEYLLNMSERATDDFEVELLYNGTYAATLFADQPLALTLNAGTTTDYSIRVRRRMPTGLNDQLQMTNDKCTKGLIDNHLYILQGAHIFDAQGKLVK